MSSLDQDTLVDPYATIGFALKTAQQALRVRLDGTLRAISLTTPQYAVLAHLAANPGASNADLARSAFVSPQTMQVIVVTLERAKLVSRARHSQHGRIQITDLTEAGRTALKAASQSVADAESRLRVASAPLTQSEVVALLQRLANSQR